MAERHAAGPSHSSLPPTFNPVVKTLSFLRAGVAPGTGLQACCGLHGCLRQGLGGHVQRACSVGVWTGPQLHWHKQLLRVAAVHLDLNRLKRRLRGEHVLVRTDKDCDRCVHQPKRWSTLPSHVTTRPPPPPLESEASEVASPHSYSGLLNRTADKLSRAALPGEWRLHPQTVQLIW